MSYRFETEKIQRRDQIRTISVSAFPGFGHLPSEVMRQVRTKVQALAATLPPGYSMEIGGSEENVKKVATDSGIVAVVSILGIFFTLVIQFQHAVKPVIVFAAIPYGVSGALIAVAIMGSPFGFTAIVGVISLIGVIVSHIIVKFDNVEEARDAASPCARRSSTRAPSACGLLLITVAATVLGLVPLAIDGGPLWEPLCYAQIGGLTLATGITLLLVPVLDSIAVLDLKWVQWEMPSHGPHSSEEIRLQVTVVESWVSRNVVARLRGNAAASDPRSVSARQGPPAGPGGAQGPDGTVLIPAAPARGSIQAGQRQGFTNEGTVVMAAAAPPGPSTGSRQAPTTRPPWSWPWRRPGH